LKPSSLFGVIRAGNSADAKMYLSEYLSDVHTSLPIPENMKLVEMFEVNVSEIEDMV
jgi:hypothetical protein